ncbi:MAG: ABC transporter ATP-binding protein [Desulfobacterales bacterium]|nr:ABC transporter ATP-binding protein [Desulfobacterales bacterium]
MEPCIRVSQISKRYNGHLAVDGVSFTVNPGEVFGFLGPNGAGKTTTQRILTGLLKPSRGSVWILDHDMAKDPMGAKEHIGIVPETANPYTELSAWKNMVLSGEFYGMSGRSLKNRAEEMLSEFGLWQRRREPVKNYSKGMKQRLVLAMALLHGPQILFLDEPTAGLDVESRRLIHEKVKTLARQGTAVFYTTHHIDEANDLCVRVAIIRQGRIVAMDRPEALKAAFQGSQSVLTAFDSPVEAEKLRRIPSVHRIEKEGDKIRLYTSYPGRVVAEVVDFAKQNNLAILSLNTLAPSLEDVFVSLAHESREPAEEKEP